MEQYLVVWWAIIIPVILVSPVHVWLDYRHRGKTEDSLSLRISWLWGLGSFSFQVPVIHTEKSGVAVKAEAGARKKNIKFPFKLSLRDILFMSANFKYLKSPLDKYLRFSRVFLKIERFVWHTELGIWDSARLGQLIGVVWSAKGMISGMLGRYLKFKKTPVLRVLPMFNTSRFRTVVSCILVFPVGYIIIAAIFGIYMVVKVKLLTKRRGEADVRTSNSGIDEDCHGKYQGNG
ncbi:MAG: DUF2953 domain-containing protein [Firmicutes bacterium]|nr:DUF2953 domain-containing protein [Bacillota bacterium]